MNEETPVLFPKGARLRHRKTGGVYEVLETPDRLRIEATNTPAYLYSDGVLQWVRPRTEMEDGRFELAAE